MRQSNENLFQIWSLHVIRDLLSRLCCRPYKYSSLEESTGIPWTCYFYWKRNVFFNDCALKLCTCITYPIKVKMHQRNLWMEIAPFMKCFHSITILHQKSLLCRLKCDCGFWQISKYNFPSHIDPHHMYTQVNGTARTLKLIFSDT